MMRSNEDIVKEILERPLSDIRRIRIDIHDYEKSQKNPKTDKPVKKGSELAKSEVSGEPLVIAKKLYDMAQINFPAIKEPKLSEWADEIEKLNRIDKQPYPLIMAVMAWSQQSGFWKRNIRSGAALRKHFEKLHMQAKVEFDEKKGKVYSV